MRESGIHSRVVLGAFAVLALTVNTARAEIAAVFTDPSQMTLAGEGSVPLWQIPQAFSNGGLHGYDTNGTLLGNNVFVATQLAGSTADPNDNPGQANTDLGFTFSAMSNGENGFDCSTDNFLAPCGNLDVPNTRPPNPAIQAANGGDPNMARLQVGNVIRFSAWMRLDPSFPLDQNNAGDNIPSVEPLVKIELWKEALGTIQDVSALTPFPTFGDRMFDNQLEALNLGTFPSEYLLEWVDLGNDNTIGFDSDAAADGRINTLNANDWTLVEVDYELDPNHWLGIGFGGPTAADNLWTTMVDAIEEIRVTFYMGDWSAADGFNANLDFGNIMVDNLMVEVFADAATAAATANPNPKPLDADFDDDLDVDSTDLSIWNTAYNSTAVGDANGDGRSDGLDFLIAQRAWGDDVSSSLQALASVPEPSSVVILVVASLSCGCGLRTRR